VFILLMFNEQFNSLGGVCSIELIFSCSCDMVTFAFSITVSHSLKIKSGIQLRLRNCSFHAIKNKYWKWILESKFKYLPQSWASAWQPCLLHVLAVARNNFVQTGSGAHSAGGCFPGGKATGPWSWPSTSNLVSRSRICDSIHPLPHTCSWCNA
jgi:hypothetical protein